MGLVALGLFGSVCNLSSLAMVMCVLAWIAAVAVWVCFSIHLGISVFLDDTCYHYDLYLSGDKKNMPGLSHLIK